MGNHFTAFAHLSHDLITPAFLGNQESSPPLSLEFGRQRAFLAWGNWNGGNLAGSNGNRLAGKRAEFLPLLMGNEYESVVVRAPTHRISTGYLPETWSLCRPNRRQPGGIGNE